MRSKRQGRARWQGLEFSPVRDGSGRKVKRHQNKNDAKPPDYSKRCRLRLAAYLPVKRAEHRRKPGGSPPRMFEATAQPAQVRGGPGFREAQGTPGAEGGGRARVPGSPFFAYFLWRSKESRSAAGRTPACNPPPATPRASAAPPSLQPYLTPTSPSARSAPPSRPANSKYSSCAAESTTKQSPPSNQNTPPARTTKTPKTAQKTTPQSPPTTKSWC